MKRRILPVEFKYKQVTFFFFFFSEDRTQFWWSIFRLWMKPSVKLGLKIIGWVIFFGLFFSFHVVCWSKKKNLLKIKVKMTITWVFIFNSEREGIYFWKKLKLLVGCWSFEEIILLYIISFKFSHRFRTLDVIWTLDRRHMVLFYFTTLLDKFCSKSVNKNMSWVEGPNLSWNCWRK